MSNCPALTRAQSRCNKVHGSNLLSTQYSVPRYLWLGLSPPNSPALVLCPPLLPLSYSRREGHLVGNHRMNVYQFPFFFDGLFCLLFSFATGIDCTASTSPFRQHPSEEGGLRKPNLERHQQREFPRAHTNVPPLLLSLTSIGDHRLQQHFALCCFNWTLGQLPCPLSDPTLPHF